MGEIIIIKNALKALFIKHTHYKFIYRRGYKSGKQTKPAVIKKNHKHLGGLQSELPGFTFTSLASA